MIDAVLLLAFLGQQECMIDIDKGKKIVREIVRVEKKTGVPRDVLAAVVLAESGGRKIIARKRGKGKRGCDVGEGQVHVRNCEPEEMRRMLVLKENLIKSAQILKHSEELCSRNEKWAACKINKYALYNAGSRKWWRRVFRILTNLRGPLNG